MAELAPDRVALIKTDFAAALAREMGYDEGDREDLASHLEVALDGPDLRLRCKWCDRELLSEGNHPSAIDDAVTAFAGDVADDLKEHRGRGDRLPWDDQR